MFLISLGTLLLLNNIDLLSYDFEYFQDYWAAILILFGLFYLINNQIFKKIMISLVGICCSILSYSYFVSFIFEC